MCSPSEPPSHLPPDLIMWVIPVHQPRAPCIMHQTWTGDLFHIWYFTCFNAILPYHPTLTLSHRVQKTLRYICVSFAVLHTGLSFSSVQSLSRVQLFVTPWTAALQASRSITNSRSLPKLMSIELVMSFNHLISVIPFCSRFQSGSFQMNQFFTSGGQSIGASASPSVLPMNIQDWSPLGWTGWISLQSKVLSRDFSNTTVQRNQFFGAQLFHSPTLTFIHDQSKNRSLD